jgi:hypothetical protein
MLNPVVTGSSKQLNLEREKQYLGLQATLQGAGGPAVSELPFATKAGLGSAASVFLD